MGAGTFEVIEHGNEAVFAFIRETGDHTLLVLANFSDTAQEVDVVDTIAARSLTDLVAGSPIDAAEVGTLAPYAFRWLALG